MFASGAMMGCLTLDPLPLAPLPAGLMPHLARRLALVPLGCSIALVLCEGLVRLFQLAPSSGVLTVDAVDFARPPRIYAPKQDVVQPSGRHPPYHLVINRLGLPRP